MMCESLVDNQKRVTQVMLLAILSQRLYFLWAGSQRENRDQKSWNSVSLNICYNLGWEKSESTTEELLGEEKHAYF